MRKLRLTVDDLRVDGFHVLPADAERQGTVVGLGGPQALATYVTCQTRCDEPTCNNGTCNTGAPCTYCA
ncbi:MAG TPA: hypothetical protein VGC13_06075 [Longimicrobium sp.]|jgi:hypothetical protein|uniref:hypothetical protein n=1 Tax=Longimicrobium sp. TaxID=2029185 RepID=UPI002ED90EDC